MHRISKPAIIASAMLLAVPAFAQMDTTPVNPPLAAPGVQLEGSGSAGASLGVIAAPDGYSEVTDWTTVTADQLQGTPLRNAVDDAEVGSVADIELTSEGQVAGVIVDVGGFLGIGVHTVKLAPEQVSVFRNADNDIMAYVNVDRATLEAMPEYEAPAG